MEDDGEDGTWQLVIHLRTKITSVIQESVSEGLYVFRCVFTCSQYSWALRLRWCSDCLNSTWIPDKKFLLTGQEYG